MFFSPQSQNFVTHLAPFYQEEDVSFVHLSILHLLAPAWIERITASPGNPSSSQRRCQDRLWRLAMESALSLEMRCTPQNQALWLPVIWCRLKTKFTARGSDSPHSRAGTWIWQVCVIKKPRAACSNYISVGMDHAIFSFTRASFRREMRWEDDTLESPLLLVGSSSVSQLSFACISTAKPVPISQSCMRHTGVEIIPYSTNFKWHLYLRTHCSEVTLHANNAGGSR